MTYCRSDFVCIHLMGLIGVFIDNNAVIARLESPGISGTTANQRRMRMEGFASPILSSGFSSSKPKYQLVNAYLNDTK